MMNWLIGGTDAHAKNYSLLIGPKESVRLAPLYDVATILPHATHTRRLRMSNEVGGRYRLDEVRARHWARFAADVRLPPAEVREMGLRMAGRLPGALSEVVANARDCGIDHPILDALVRTVSARAEDCARILGER